jgi:hypothetical protein
LGVAYSVYPDRVPARPRRLDVCLAVDFCADGATDGDGRCGASSTRAATA